MASGKVFTTCKVCRVWGEVRVERRTPKVRRVEVIALREATVERSISYVWEYSHNGHEWREYDYEGWIKWRVQPS